MTSSSQRDSSPVDGEPINEQEAIRRMADRNDPSGRYYAAWWLGRQRSRHPRTVPLLLEALRERCTPGNADATITPIAIARNAVRAMAKLGDDAQPCINELLATLESDDTGLVECTARTLGELRVKAALPGLRRLLASQSPTTPYEAVLEAIGMLASQDPSVCAELKPFTTHHKILVRCAANRALLQITREPIWADALLELLQNKSIGVRRASLLDLAAAGWLPAAESIAKARVEANLKLVALRELTEQCPPGKDRTLLEAMDDLL